MSELKELTKRIAEVESHMAKQRNALREIRSRVDKAMAEPDIWERIRQEYGRPFEQLDCGPRHGWSMKDGEPELRIPQMGESYLSVVSLKPGKCIVSIPHSSRLILTPVEPDVYEQIREKYGKPFEELSAPVGFVLLPILRKATPGEWWLGERGSAFIGPTASVRLIIRPARRITYVEDPDGGFVQSCESMCPSVVAIDAGKTRYRRVEEG